MCKRRSTFILEDFLSLFVDGNSAWAIDGLIIGGTLMPTNMLTADFESGLLAEDWLYHPGGHLDHFCPHTSNDAKHFTQTRLVENLHCITQ